MLRTSNPNARPAIVLLLVVGLLAPFAYARDVVRAKQVAAAQYDAALKMREALNGQAPAERSRKDYQRVTDGFRRVYYGAPTSSVADAAVLAVAELLAEAGRAFDDEKSLNSAIGQYEFLCREYPGSKYRVNALFTIAQIYKEDLHDTVKARATLQDFLKRYPRSHLAEEARVTLAELDRPAAPGKKDREITSRETPTAEARVTSAPAAPASVSPAASAAQVVAESRPSRLPVVTGVRHWSTPDYTRVAIDIDAEVKYEAGRVADPDRIFFDLHDTKLASTLVGKSFDVQDGLLRKIRVAQFQRGLTRVVLEVSDVADYSAFLLPNPYRLIIDIHGKQPARPQTAMARKEAAREAQKAEESAPAEAAVTVAPKNVETTVTEAAPATPKPKAEETARSTAEPKSPRKRATNVKDTEAKATEAEDTTVVTAQRAGSVQKATQKPTTAPTYEAVAPRETATAANPRTKSKSSKTREIAGREARPTATGERSLTRALGLKIGRIVVDAGHGGHDTGTIGPNGLQEKDLVLDVALRLGKLLSSRLGADVVYTRDDDTFIPLETRTAIANQAQADLFISIHANSSSDASARGVETYYLNFTSAADALEVAARENAVSAKSIHELQDLVKKITLKDKIDESREFAADVQTALWTGVSAKSPAVRNRGVKKAPFIVLIGANMPSILAEISFLSNPTDEQRLQTPEYRQKIADYLLRGVQRYVNGLSGLKVATNRPDTKGGAE